MGSKLGSRVVKGYPAATASDRVVDLTESHQAAVDRRFGDPKNKGHSILGSISGSPYLWNRPNHGPFLAYPGLGFRYRVRVQGFRGAIKWEPNNPIVTVAMTTCTHVEGKPV